MQMYEESWKK